MSVKVFLFLLSFFTVLNNMTVELTKNMLIEKNKKFSSNFIAIIEGMLIGTIGVILYCVFKHMIIDIQMILFAILMGGATVLASMQSYDKISQLISQIDEL